jgi:hypothetical protein
LITKEIPLKGELDKDIETVTSAARQIVATAKSLPAYALSSANLL